MPLPFEEFQEKGVLDFCSSAASDSFSLLWHQQPQNLSIDKGFYCYVGTEPNSVLDSRRSPNPSLSSSTMSSSVAATNLSENPLHASLESSTEKCDMRMEDWEGQDQSIMRLIMGDVEDPSAGLSKLFQTGGCGYQNVDFNRGFGVVDEGLNMVSIIDPSVQVNYHAFPFVENIDCYSAKTGSVSVSESIPVSANSSLLVLSSPGVFNSQQQQLQQQGIGVVDEKPRLINPQLMLNQNQARLSNNPSFFVPLTYPQMQEQEVFSQHQAERPLSDTVGHNYQVPRFPLLDCGQELFARRQQKQLPLFPHHHLQQLQPLVVPSAKQKKVNSTGDDASNQLQQSIFDQLYKTAELIEAGNPVLAQGILARLNQQLSPVGKPFQRATFYMKEALQLLLNSNIHNSIAFSPINFIFKIGAYKSFSEISPVLQFVNFTCNQALVEALEKFDRVHIIDFDIGFGEQWSSFMQELALRNNSATSLKVTAIVSPSTCDNDELNFIRQNLNQYAKDINMFFELDVLSIESLNSPSCQFFDNEAIAVNLPLSCLINYPSLVPSVLHFVKQLRPKVVVTFNRNCDRIDVPFSTNIVHTLQCFSALLESLDAVNLSSDVLHIIERHFIQPAIKKIIFGHQRSHEKLPPWPNLFLQTGFSPITFSNFTEAQAECLVQRAPVRGFQVERRHSSLVLCWQRKELISVSTWRC
ncbi:hypothetical protein Lal_00018651 [Lupinus albus]|nr:hypothetical protein Lal_00018651 [Lupinus albus]